MTADLAADIKIVDGMAKKLMSRGSNAGHDRDL